MGSPWSPATPGAKYCGALMPPEAVSMGRPGDGNGRAGTAGVGVEYLVVHHDVLRGIGRER